MRNIVLSLGLLLAASQSLARLYTISNGCPQSVNLYINGESQGRLAVGATTIRQFNETWSGFIYTDANGGSSSGLGTARAGFYGASDYYYIVVDSRLNTGISIEPQASNNNGFCGRDMCDNKACNSIYNQPPTSFPPPSTTPPTPPLYACPGDNVGYKVTLCPSGVFPPPINSDPVNIHPIGNKNKCLDVRGAKFANGTAVQIYDCNGTEAQKWLISAGLTLVRLFVSGATAQYCLDAGSTPGNGVAMKIRECFEGSAAQAWYYTEDKHIQLNGTNQCLDLPSGSTANGNQIQTWQCSNGNTNQIWTFP